jgi:hypothetical protein
MASEEHPRDLLAHARRAETAPWTDYPPTPWWYFPSVGAWTAAMILVLAGVPDRPVVFGPLAVVLLALEGAFIGWYSRLRGAMPRLRQAPAEFAPVLRAFAVGTLGVVAAVTALVVWVGAVPAAALAFVAVTTGLVVHERHYAAAARAVRARVS